MAQIGKLIIVGGPSGAGKSHLINKIVTGHYPELSRQLRMGNPQQWRYELMRKFSTTDLPEAERLLIHYDFYAQHNENEEFSHVAELVNNAGSVVVLTLETPTQILVNRINKQLFTSLLTALSPVGLIGSESNMSLHWRRQKKKIKKLYWKRKSYTQGHSRFLYDRWYAFLRQKNLTDHWIIDTSRTEQRSASPYEFR